MCNDLIVFVPLLMGLIAMAIVSDRTFPCAMQDWPIGTGLTLSTLVLPQQLICTLLFTFSPSVFYVVGIPFSML